MGSLPSLDITEICASNKLGVSGLEVVRELNALRKGVIRVPEVRNLGQCFSRKFCKRVDLEIYNYI